MPSWHQAVLKLLSSCQKRQELRSATNIDWQLHKTKSHQSSLLATNNTGQFQSFEDDDDCDNVLSMIEIYMILIINILTQTSRPYCHRASSCQRGHHRPLNRRSQWSCPLHERGVSKLKWLQPAFIAWGKTQPHNLHNCWTTTESGCVWGGDPWWSPGDHCLLSCPGQRNGNLGGKQTGLPPTTTRRSHSCDFDKHRQLFDRRTWSWQQWKNNRLSRPRKPRLGLRTTTSCEYVPRLLCCDKWDKFPGDIWLQHPWVPSRHWKPN